MVDAMDLSKADIITMVGDFMSDCAEMLGVENDSDQICLAIETLKVERDDAIRRADKARAVYVTARALWEAVSLVQPGGGMANKDTVYRACRALEDALDACTAWDEETAALDLSPKPQSVDTSARHVDGGDGSKRQGTHAPGCEMAVALVSHETPIGERQTDDGMGGGHGG